MVRSTESAAKTERPDGRRKLMLYLDPDIVKRLKQAALDQDRPAYLIAEEILGAALKKRS